MKRYRIWFWISPIICAILVMVSIRLVSDTPTGYKFWERPIEKNLIEDISAIILAYIFQYVTYFFLKKNRYLCEFSLKKLLKEYLYVLFIGIIIINPGLIIIHYLTKDPPGLDDFVIATTIFVLYSLIFYSIFRGKQILDAYISEKLQVQKIKNMQMQTELKFLRAQFHPHFLFNVLNTIYFQIDEKNETARNMIEKLSDLLRYQLYDTSCLVYLKQEFDFIETYISIQKLRMKDSLKLDVSFNEKLFSKQIYPLLLFPFVENALKYVGGEYWIKISAWLEDDSLSFEVVNAIPELTEPKIKRKGIGLEMLKRRLQLLYPEKYQIQTNRVSEKYIAKLIIKL
jgi:two-component system, LytTR family, sensor kinase